MASTAELTARLEALKKARDSGVLTIRKGDDWTTFRSLKEMSEVIAALEGEIAGTDTSKPRVRTIRLHGKDGW